MDGPEPGRLGIQSDSGSSHRINLDDHADRDEILINTGELNLLLSDLYDYIFWNIAINSSRIKASL